ncbi:MAG: ABC transporter permease subunit [Candidatus Acidiferrales bacterium]
MSISAPTSAQPEPRIFRRFFAEGRVESRLVDAVVFAAMGLAIYGLWRTGHAWTQPAASEARISMRPSALPGYAFDSLLRIAIAYVLSLIFAIAYGYAAARSAAAERILIPLLDVLQSIPVLSFLPAVMLAMVALFPSRQAGLELGSILLIFTGQVWNIAFSMYASLRAIPTELKEAARVYRFSPWQRFIELELPYSAIGLVWNSMMSVAGGWFFLMACEMFQLNNRDFRLPGLGSYLQRASSAGDTKAIAWGLAAMIGVIVLLDQLVWRPVIAWADKFKMESVGAANVSRSAVLTLLRRSELVAALYRRAVAPAGERLMLSLARPAGESLDAASAQLSARRGLWQRGRGAVVYAAAFAVTAWLALHGYKLIVQLGSSEIRLLLRGAAYTFLRVQGSLLLGALWTVPLGVAIGLSPRLARIAQPLVQIAASVPATALFPVILLALLRFGGGMGVAAIVLMLLGTQWYILFNVIAGAIAIPSDLREVARVFRFGSWNRWRLLILPAIFPYLVTGLITASGGAWNASIIAEYFHFRGATLETTGLGSIISSATDAGRMDVLLAATMLMALIVVSMNRLVWRRLYRLGENRFKLDA